MLQTIVYGPLQTMSPAEVTECCGPQLHLLVSKLHLLNRVTIAHRRTVSNTKE